MIRTDKNNFFKEAFCRNIGLISNEELKLLSEKCVAIAGLGGVGGSYALTLARMGVGRFVLSDYDHFEIANFNRQAGAMMSSLSQPKSHTIKKMLLDINPHLEISLFENGLDLNNTSGFVEKADVIVDAIDFFALDSHRALHQECRKQNKVSLFSVPAGHSGTLQVFHPQGMSFDSYFDFKDGEDYFDLLCKFGVGIAPKGLHARYLKFDPETLLKGRPTSIASACALSAGLVSQSALMILLKRFEERFYAPFYVQFDSHLLTSASGKLHYGNRGIWQRIKLKAFRNELESWREKFNNAYSKLSVAKVTEEKLKTAHNFRVGA